MASSLYLSSVGNADSASASVATVTLRALASTAASVVAAVVAATVVRVWLMVSVVVVLTVLVIAITTVGYRLGVVAIDGSAVAIVVTEDFIYIHWAATGAVVTDVLACSVGVTSCFCSICGEQKDSS